MARLFSGCCAYSYGQELKRGTTKLEDFILKAVELIVLFKIHGPKYLISLRRLAYKNILAVSDSARRQPERNQEVDGCHRPATWPGVGYDSRHRFGYPN